MLRTLEEWKEFCSKRGTSGEIVYDILRDWEEREKKFKDLEELQDYMNHHYYGENE